VTGVQTCALPIWWDHSGPILGFDSTVVAFDGGYRKTL
jgi:hypothetical protein